MEKTCTEYQQFIFPQLPFLEIVEGDVKQQDGQCLPDNAVMGEEQTGYEHEKAHLGNILAMAGNKPHLTNGNDQTGEEDDGIGIL